MGHSSEHQHSTMLLLAELYVCAASAMPAGPSWAAIPHPNPANMPHTHARLRLLLAKTTWTLTRTQRSAIKQIDDARTTAQKDVHWHPLSGHYFKSVAEYNHITQEEARQAEYNKARVAGIDDEFSRYLAVLAASKPAAQAAAGAAASSSGFGSPSSS